MAELTPQDKARIKTEFRRISRRTLRVLLGLFGFFALAMVIEYIPFLGGAAQEAGKAPFVVLGGAGFWLFYFFTWRCPNCGCYLLLRLRLFPPAKCPRCGVELR